MNPNTVLVWDVETDTVIEVTTAEATAGMMRYARSLGAGTPACAVAERQAMAITEGLAK